ncbi:MAG: hypothetical protein B0D91_00740 [Oceanospirillales bacterium LUC14_002_19_P2]|nr:MAG: hypothetical protein B0D91_00740 [Oceanospirillales bacterium LUC14_002_19_P2]
MEHGLTLSFREMIVVAMALFNLVLWGPIGWTVRRLVNDYDSHKLSNRESLESLRAELDAMEARFHDLRAELPEKYVGVRRFDEQMARIQDLFQRIMDKLEAKADKE